MAIWLSHSDDRGRDLSDDIRVALVELGIDAASFDPVSVGGTGVLVSGGTGILEFLNALPRVNGIRIIVVLDGGVLPDIEEIREWIFLGVVDVLCGESPRDAAAAIHARLERHRRVASVFRSPLVQKNLIGTSAVWRETITSLIEMALFSDKFVLITGESGTGKELAARLIHSLDPKVNGRDLVLVDCTTIVPSLSGSELFGHTEDAFTGAVKARKGAFEMADNSTLFLDEIGELPLDLQAGLLRVIQEKSFKRVGSNTWKKTQFRLVAATNRDLSVEVRSGRFREDLFHRISAWHCHMPPLRDRTEDILPLAEYFLKTYAQENGPGGFDSLMTAVLKSREYTGNVRELQNLVVRLVGRHVGGGDVTIGDLPVEDWPQKGSVRKVGDRNKMVEALEILMEEGLGMQEIGEVTSDLLTHIATSRAGGNLARAAKMLKVTPRALQQRRKRQREQVPG